MNDIEDLIRDSLRQRAEDVEPTPALWTEVDRRIARRRRWQVASWSLAGVAAALAAIVIVPGVVGGNGPGPFEIEPSGPGVTGAVPSTAVVADAGEVSLLDLDTGERSPLDVGDGAPIDQLSVRPGSTDDDYRFVMVQSQLLTFAASSAEGSVTGVLAEHAVESGFVPSITWGPEGDHVAYTIPGGDGEASVIVEAAPSGGAPGFLDPMQGANVGTIGEDDELLGWFGSATEPGDTSVLLVRTADTTIRSIEVEALEAEGAFAGTFEGEQPTRIEGTFDLAPTPGSSDGGPLYALAPGSEAGSSLYWVDADAGPDDDEVVEVPLGEVVGDADPGALWLDARQDAALVGDGERVWLFAHDGAGRFVEPVELATDVSVGALFDAASSGAEDATDDASDDPADDPTGDATDGEEPTPDPDPDATDGDASSGDPDGASTGSLGVSSEPTVIASAQELRLVGPDGARTLVTLPDEGESVFLAARVRPGSSIDDLTVVALTTAEGLYDLRHLHVVDGEVVTWEPFEGTYAPGVDAVDGLQTATGPVWSPDGEHLAWIENAGDAPTLRTIGWDGGPGTGDRATDNASFTLDGFGVSPLVPVAWVATPGEASSTELRVVFSEASQGWFGIPVYIQGDGALALPSGQGSSDWGTDWDVAGSPTVEGVGAVLEPDGTVAWLLQTTFPEGAELIRDPSGEAERFTVPEDLWPDDGLPAYFVRPLGDGVVIGARDTGTAYAVDTDGRFTRIEAGAFDVDAVD